MTFDSLFYKDRVLARLRTIGVPELSGKFAKAAGTTDDQYFSGILEFIKDHSLQRSLHRL